MQTRRHFGRTIGGAALAAVCSPRLSAQKPDLITRGVRLGAITGSLGPFNNIPEGKDVTDVVIEQCLAATVGNVELVNSLYEPRVQGGGIGGQAPANVTPEYTKSREALREWRLTTPPEFFAKIRRKFDAAGLNLFSFVMTIGDDFTDEEIDAVFRQMQALKVGVFCTNQTRVSAGPRMAPYAEKYKIMPAFHTHALVNDPNEVASPASLQRLMEMSPLFRINLDIGHFARGGNNPSAYFQEHLDRITHLHVKDHKADNTSVEIGEGDLHVKDMLHLVRDRKLPVAFILERDYRGTGTSVEETRKQMEIMRAMLES
jgi:sugar phosphate isomerase/epimerase